MANTVNLTQNGEITKTIILPGNGDMPKEGQEAIFTYALKKGNAASKQGSMRYLVGSSQINRGLNIAIKSMKLNEQAEVTIGHQYNDTSEGECTYEITLQDIRECVINPLDLNNQQKEEYAYKYKQLGNEQFKQAKYAKASQHYQLAYECVSNILEIEVKPELKQLKLQILTNICIAENKMHHYNKTIEYCAKLSNICDELPPKALYCRAVAYIDAKKYDDAYNDLLLLIKKNPTDEGIKTTYMNVSAILDKRAVKEKEVYKSMFSQPLYESDKK